MATHLVDTSALIKARASNRWGELLPPFLDGKWAICEIVMIEILRGTDAKLYPELQRTLRAMPMRAIETIDVAKALDIQYLLADRGMHQGVKPPDLLVAATALRHRLAVIHDDADFELIQQAVPALQIERF
jgi:predicted nucleic acid-binding protein